MKSLGYGFWHVWPFGHSALDAQSCGFKEFKPLHAVAEQAVDCIVSESVAQHTCPLGQLDESEHASVAPLHDDALSQVFVAVCPATTTQQMSVDESHVVPPHAIG